MNINLRQGASANTTVLDLGPVALIFSYSTCVAFHVHGEGWTVSENIWGRVTGRHISQNTPERNGPGGMERTPYPEFETKLQRVFDRLAFSATTAPPRTVGISLHKILNYMWADEQHDYEIHQGLSDDKRDYSEDHVFTHLQRVEKWLTETGD